MSFYEFIETTQAILVSFILTDGSSWIVSAIYDYVKNLLEILKWSPPGARKFPLLSPFFVCEKMTLHIKVISSCYHTAIAVLSASSDSAKYPFLHHRNNLSTTHIRAQCLGDTHRAARMLRGRRAAPSERARESRCARSGDPLQPPSNYLKSTTQPE